ncbi:response regulator transcription factor [Adlercreutzia aquisgranensis]|uniref:response regulator transcription factor n=1 Tax=Adlercreutzia aquisgranensis TaxID=2941323 RepID=UPI00203AF79D|nr:response regulator transcription factor [Adlercreutzia aquisgranensis]
MEESPLIYYVEDDEHVRDLTSYALRQAGFQVHALPEARKRDFVAECAKAQPAAVLLDIMLPGDDGMELLRALRASDATEAIPVLMLTAKGTEFDKVVGLDAGADDYLSKPYGMMELISRVNALVRRASRPAHVSGKAAGAAGAPGAAGTARAASALGAASAATNTAASAPDLDDVLQAGDIELSPLARTAEVGGVELSLTRKEFDLLRFLMENRGRVLTREQLLEAVWGISFVGETRTVDMHVKTLRKKLAQARPGAEGAIVTVRGSGYRLRKGDR